MPVDPRRYVQVAVHLRAQLASGKLESGDRLNIGLLADTYEVSRPTVAHALRVLEADGLVLRYPGVGWVVA